MVQKRIKIHMKKTLIVVDMINDFCNPNGVLAQSNITGKFYAEEIMIDVVSLVEVFRSQKLPIIWLCDAHAENDKEFERFPAHAIKGTWGAEIIGQLGSKYAERSPYELRINKTRYSGFYGTALEYQLMRIAPEQVEVCGVCTSICIMDTVGGLANRDYEIQIQRSCVADFDPGAGEKALTRMSNLYGVPILP
jgi:nicotinamidase/pyrazinamidase